jgi:hypothetical protein
LRSTISDASLISIDQDRGINLSGLSGWRHAAARPWSPARGAIRTSIGIVRDGMRRQGTGKPDEIERLMSGLERGHRKSTIKLKRQLADVLLYLTSGSVRAEG